MSIETLKGKIQNIEDPRRTSYGNIRHKLEDIVIIGLCTLTCGGADYADMEEFGIEREEFLRQFLELPNGIPDSDTFRRIFERLNPEELSENSQFSSASFSCFHSHYLKKILNRL